LALVNLKSFAIKLESFRAANSIESCAPNAVTLVLTCSTSTDLFSEITFGPLLIAHSLTRLVHAWHSLFRRRLPLLGSRITQMRFVNVRCRYGDCAFVLFHVGAFEEIVLSYMTFLCVPNVLFLFEKLRVHEGKFEKSRYFQLNHFIAQFEG
jgi:hypothetical protein